MTMNLQPESEPAIDLETATGTIGTEIATEIEIESETIAGGIVLALPVPEIGESESVLGKKGQTCCQLPR